MSEDRRVLVTLHLPIEMRCAAEIMTAVAKAYPEAVVGENGTIWTRPARYANEDPEPLTVPAPVTEASGS